MIEHWGRRYVLDLKVGHFRQLSSPFEVIEFESERGKGIGVVVGMMAYLSCRVTCWLRVLRRVLPQSMARPQVGLQVQ